MSEPVVNSPAPVAVQQNQTDFQAWLKLPEDERNAVAQETPSSATEPAKAAAAAKTSPASEPDSSDQEKAKETQAREDAEVPKGLQKRFKELTTKIRNLEGQLATRPAAEPAKAAEAPVKTEPAKAAEPLGGILRPKSEDYGTYDEYILELQNWNLDQRDLRRQKAETDQAEAARTQENGREWQKELAAARERYDDYDDVALTDMPINRATHDAIVEGGRDGAELAYYLGQHRDEAADIFKLSPIKTTLALGRIIATFSGAPDQTKQPAVSRAPKPPKPVAGSGGADSIGKEPDPSDYPKWSKWNAKREAAEAAD